MSRAVIEARMRLKSIVTVEAVAPDGRVVHRQVIPNVVTDEGIEALKTLTMSELVGCCWLGRGTSLPAVTDTMDTIIVKAPLGWHTQLKDFATAIEAYQGASPTLVQGRTFAAVSQENGGYSDAKSYVADAAAYWKLVRTRLFYRDASYFVGSAFPVGTDIPSGFGGSVGPAWAADGRQFGPLVEGSFLGEVGWCASAPHAPYAARVDMSVNGVDVFAPCFDHDSALWDRVLLPQTLGYQPAPGEASVYYPWNGNVAEVLLEHDYVIKVTLELRLFPDTSEAVQVIDINGVSTTCTTRAVDIDGSEWQAALTDLGTWRLDARSAGVLESLTIPGALTDPVNQAAIDLADDAVQVATAEAGQQVMQYNFGASKGLFSGGIQGLLHGNFSASPVAQSFCYATTFDPPVAKTNEERHEFNVRYTWSRR